MDRRFRARQHWALERRSFTQRWKEVKLDDHWDLCSKIWEVQWRLKYKVTVRQRILWRIDWVQDSERNTSTRGIAGCKNESKTGTSPSINKVFTATICTDVGTKPGSASIQQQHCKFAGLVFYSPWIPHSTTRWMLTKPMMDLVMGCDSVMDEQDTRCEHRDPERSTSGQRWSWPSRRMCHERIMAAVAMTRCSANFCQHWLTSKLVITFSP